MGESLNFSSQYLCLCSVRMYRAGQGRRHAGQQQGQQQQQPASPLIQLMQFAPLILLLLFSFLSRPSQPVRDMMVLRLRWWHVVSIT